MDEYWTNIKDYPDYAVSTFGNVENMKTGRILKPAINSNNGYLFVVLYKNGKAKTCTIHQLVADAFLDNPENKNCVDHKNGNKFDNSINNLRYATHIENSRNRKMSSKNTSGVKGVCFDSNTNKWRAYIRLDGILVHLGRFKTIEDAKQARINKANEVFGEFINDCEN
jgi:hypothetical protein